MVEQIAEDPALQPVPQVLFPMAPQLPGVQQPPPAPIPIIPAGQLVEPVEEQGYNDTSQLVVCANPLPTWPPSKLVV